MDGIRFWDIFVFFLNFFCNLIELTLILNQLKYLEKYEKLIKIHHKLLE